MALPISDDTLARTRQTVLHPAIVLEIDGVSTIYGAQITKKFVRIGDAGLEIGDDWVIGGTDEVEDQSDIISLKGTTTTIAQQLLQEKGGTGGPSSMQVQLIDLNNQATELISPGVVVEELLGRKCRLWISFADSAYPENYVIVFRGIIAEITADAMVTLTISSPEQKKLQEIFPKIQHVLDGAINNSVTTITLDSVEGFLSPADGTTLWTYIRIDDEIIRYTGINTATKQLTGCSRAQLGTVADSHDDEQDVASFYRLRGDAIDLALKVLCSGLDGPWVEDLTVKSFVSINPTTDVDDAILFERDLEMIDGIVVGDFVTITGATNGANNVVSTAISSIVKADEGTYIILEGAGLVVEATTSAVASFQSQYDVLGHGLALGGDEVDVAEFLRLQELFLSSIPTYDFYLKETTKARDFIDTQILFPAACYSIPRKGRISLGFSSPPVAIGTLPALNADAVMEPKKTQVRRSIAKYFYNEAVYRFEEDALEEKFRAGIIDIQADSLTRINVGGRPFTVTAKGLRNDAASVTIIEKNMRRILERYAFAAETIKVQVLYGVGFPIEVGDIVLYGDPTMDLPDTKFGTREFTPRLMEVVNKSMNIKTGAVSLDLVDTNYTTTGRYGIFSPSTVLDSGCTTTTLKVTNSFGFSGGIEADKWRTYINEKIIIHDVEWQSTQESYLRAISSSDPYSFTIDAISTPPAAGDILDIAPYQQTSAQLGSYVKARHCFADPSIPVTSGVSGVAFNVSAPDAAKILVGATVLLTNDWVVISDEVKVESVAGTLITVDTDLGFTPDSTYTVELVGFKDGGAAYRYL